MAPKKARKKKVAAKRQAWNKGLEIGKKDAFTPDQVKRIRSVLEARCFGPSRPGALLDRNRHHVARTGSTRTACSGRAASKRFDPFNHQGLEEKERSAGQMRSFQTDRESA